MTSSPTSPASGVAVLVPRLDGAAEGAGLELAAIDGQEGDAADERGADVGAARGGEEPGISADVLVDPLEALGRERRAGRADGTERERSRPCEGSTPAFMQEARKLADVPKVVTLGLRGEVPQGVESGVAGVAVVEDDRRVGEEHRDEEVPHHPAGGGEPEDAVAVLRVDVEVHLLQVLEEDAAVSLDDRLGEAGGARRVEDPQGVVEGDAVELESRAGALGGDVRSRRCRARGAAGSASGSR